MIHWKPDALARNALAYASGFHVTPTLPGFPAAETRRD
jgi:hypothetical protein